MCEPKFLTPGMARSSLLTCAVIIAVVFGLTAVAVPFLGEEFLPDFKETDFLMHWVGKPGPASNPLVPLWLAPRMADNELTHIWLHLPSSYCGNETMNLLP